MRAARTQFPPCHIIERDAISCANISTLIHISADDSPHHAAALHYARRLGSSSHHSVCSVGLVETHSPAACDAHKWEAAHVAHDILYYISVTILSAFALELCVLLCVLGLHFARQPLYMLDAAVVATALYLEVCLRRQGHGGELAGLLVFARSWRFVRIGHGLSTSVHEAGHKHVEEMKHHIQELEDELSRLRAKR